MMSFLPEVCPVNVSLGNQFQIHPLNSCPCIEHELPEQLSHFEIIVVKSGSGTLTTDLRKYTLAADTIYCITPGQYRLLTVSEDISGYYLSISPELLYISESMISRFGNEWLVSSSPGIEELVVRMYKESRYPDSMYLEILRSLIKVFMLYLYRARQVKEEENAGGDKMITRKFFELLQRNFTSKKLVTDYASELCITPNYLNAVVKKQTGFPVSYHIQQHIIMEAKRQAMYSDLRMKEVANRLGFDDYAHFSKFFKNYAGVNFSDFKRGILA